MFSFDSTATSADQLRDHPFLVHITRYNPSIYPCCYVAGVLLGGVLLEANDLLLFPFASNHICHNCFSFLIILKVVLILCVIQYYTQDRQFC